MRRLGDILKEFNFMEVKKNEVKRNFQLIKTNYPYPRKQNPTKIDELTNEEWAKLTRIHNSLVDNPTRILTLAEKKLAAEFGWEKIFLSYSRNTRECYFSPNPKDPVIKFKSS